MGGSRKPLRPPKLVRPHSGQSWGYQGINAVREKVESVEGKTDMPGARQRLPKGRHMYKGGFWVCQKCQGEDEYCQGDGKRIRGIRWLF